MNESLPFPEVLKEIFDRPEVAIAQLYRLSDMSPEEMEAVMARWPELPEQRRRIVTRHLADLSEENFVVDFSPLLRRFLSDPSPEVRLAALDGLWDTSNTTCVSPIIRLMEEDAEERVRAAAAATLGHFVLLGEWGQLSPRISERIVAALLATFDSDRTSAMVRRATVESLGNSAHPRVAQIIDDGYHQGEETMRLSAVFAMGRSADPRWLPTILDEMSSPEPEMRMEAARAAGNLGSSDAVERLVELLEDEELEVQLAAVTALGQVGNEQAQEALQELMQDPESIALLEAAEAALEEIEWLGGEIDLTMMDWDEDELA